MEWIDEKEGKNMPRDVRVTDANGNDRLSNLETKINELHEAFITNKDAGVQLNGSNVEIAQEPSTFTTVNSGGILDISVDLDDYKGVSVAILAPNVHQYSCYIHPKTSAGFVITTLDGIEVAPNQSQGPVVKNTIGVGWPKALIRYKNNSASQQDVKIYVWKIRRY